MHSLLPPHVLSDVMVVAEFLTSQGATIDCPGHVSISTAIEWMLERSGQHVTEIASKAVRYVLGHGVAPKQTQTTLKIIDNIAAEESAGTPLRYALALFCNTFVFSLF